MNVQNKREKVFTETGNGTAGSPTARARAMRRAAQMLVGSPLLLVLATSREPPPKWVLPSQCNASSNFLREPFTHEQKVKAIAASTYATVSRQFLHGLMQEAHRTYNNFLEHQLPDIRNPVLLDIGAGSGLYDIFVHRHYSTNTS